MTAHRAIFLWVSTSVLLLLTWPLHVQSFQGRGLWNQPCQVNRYSARRDSLEEESDGKVLDRKFLERNKYWVVLVDDEEAIRRAVGDYLYDQGYQMTACADADALLEVCNQPRSVGELLRTPDAIISDIRMPGKDGLQLLEILRQDERLKRVPVVLLTAKGMTQDRIAGYKAGADFYLPKPFDPNELLAILDNSILRKRQKVKAPEGDLQQLQEEMANLKSLMKQKGSNMVQKTETYLTLAEREVLELLCKGLTNTEIAQERGVAPNRVSRVIQKLYSETGTKTRTELVRWAIKTGYVSPR